MRKLSIDEIHSYINKEDILNCAASIKISLVISLIEKTEADPTSIIGFPPIKLRNYLNRLCKDTILLQNDQSQLFY